MIKLSLQPRWTLFFFIILEGNTNVQIRKRHSFPNRNISIIMDNCDMGDPMDLWII